MTGETGCQGWGLTFLLLICRASAPYLKVCTAQLLAPRWPLVACLVFPHLTFTFDGSSVVICCLFWRMVRFAKYHGRPVLLSMEVR